MGCKLQLGKHTAIQAPLSSQQSFLYASAPSLPSIFHFPIASRELIIPFPTSVFKLDFPLHTHTMPEWLLLRAELYFSCYACHMKQAG